MKPLISIVIPVYNSEENLPSCLDSILNQSYTNFEIILINDGSKDNSKDVLEEYKKKYPKKIRVYNQENKGPAETRNKGIELAKGTYLFFIDNDDYIESEYIETFVNAIEDTSYDMVIGGYKRVNLSGKILFKRDPKDAPWTKYMLLAPWGRVYRTESLRKYDIKFMKGNIWEDVYFNMVANYKLNIKILNYNGYHWIYNDNSFSNTVQKNLNPFVDLTSAFDVIKKDVTNLIIDEEENILFEYFFIKGSIWYLLHSGKGIDYDILHKEYLKLFSWLEQNFPNYLKNKQISILRPEGEVLMVRFTVWFFILLKKIHLEKLFLRIYSLL